MKTNKRIRKVLSVLLTLCVMLSYVPVTAFAVTEDNLCGHHAEHTADCGYVEGEADCVYHCEICHVQALVDALPESVTAENGEAVKAQLAAIDTEKASLSAEETAQVDFAKYTAATEALGSVYDTDPGDTGTTYTVTVAETTNGTVTADKATAAQGGTVTLTVSPAEGYEIDSVSYNDGTNDVTVTASEGVYSFTMPASNVTVTAAFRAHTHSTTAEGDRAATCIAQAYCSVCQQSYGDLADHTPDGNGKCTLCGGAFWTVTVVVEPVREYTCIVPAGQDATFDGLYVTEGYYLREVEVYYKDTYAPVTGFRCGYETVTIPGEYITEDLTVQVCVQTADIGVHSDHVYAGVPTFTWAEDHSTATATWICLGDGAANTVDCTVTSQTQDATCAADGKTTYTATATWNGTDYTDTRTVSISTDTASHTPDGNGRCTVCGYQYPFSTYDSYVEDITTGFYADLDSALAVANGVSHVTVLADYTIGETVEVSGLILSRGVTLTNNGSLTIGGALTNNGTIVNNGTLILPSVEALSGLTAANYSGSGSVKVGYTDYILHEGVWYPKENGSERIYIDSDTPASYYTCDEGYALYDGNGKLTLNGASVIYNNPNWPADVIRFSRSMEIVLNGENTVTAGGPSEAKAIEAYSDLTISGSGSLTVTAWATQDAIAVTAGTLTLNSGTVTLKGNTNDIRITGTTLPAVAEGTTLISSGITTLGNNKSYTWNGSRFICAEGSHTFTEAAGGRTASCACGAAAAFSVTTDGNTAYYTGATFDDLDNAITAGSTVKLYQDLSDDGQLSLDQGCTLDLNGYTINVGSNLFLSTGTFTIKNGTIRSSTSNSVLNVSTRGQVTIEDITIAGENAAYGATVYGHPASSTITIGRNCVIGGKTASIQFRYFGYVKMTTPPDEGTVYSVYMDSPDYFTSPYDNMGGYQQYFTSAVPGYVVTEKNGSLYLTPCDHSSNIYTYRDNGNGTHTKVCAACGAGETEAADHRMTYAPDEDAGTIAYKCGDCGGADVTFTLVIPTGAVYGSASVEVPRFTCSREDYNGVRPTLTVDGKENHYPTAVGTYDVAMTWGGETVRGKYTIGKAALTAAQVTVEGTFTYNGKAHTPEPRVKIMLNGRETALTKDTDYTVSYSNNINAGTATVTVTGVGSYTGTATATFPISKARITVTANDVTVPLGTNMAAVQFTYTVSGLWGTDTLTKGPEFGLSAVPDTGREGEYTITPGNADGGSNYEILAYKTGILKVRSQRTVTVAAAANGKVSVSHNSAIGGTRVTVTVTPNSGCKLSTLVVTDAGGKQVAVTTDNNGKYSFTMPDSNVTVKATFANASSDTADSANPDTGDGFDPVLWSGILCASALCFVTLLTNRKRKME